MCFHSNEFKWKSHALIIFCRPLLKYRPAQNLTLDPTLLQQPRHQVGLCSLQDQEFIQCERCNSQNITISCGLQFSCASCSACYVGETNWHLATHVREHLTSDKNSHIFQHINRSETCKALCSEDCFSLLDTASTSFQLKIKEALHIGWEKPLLNKQVNHVNLSLSF